MKAFSAASAVLRWFRRGLFIAGVVVLSGGSAQVTPAMPTVDLSVGPVAISTQAVNVALALSVEFPTVGAAYRTGTYDHSVTYLGYWDSNGCYQYKDITPGAPINGEYFYRVADVDATTKYCNGATYSGNVLNYVATSSIDLLRYALTGGNRVVDTEASSVLERAYLYNSWNLHNGTYFPAHRIAAAMVGLVTPNYTVGSGDVYGGSCLDRIWFGRSNSSQSCSGAGGTTSGNLNQGTVSGTATQTVQVPQGDPAPPFSTYSTTTWAVTSPLQTSTVAPASGPIDTYQQAYTIPGTTTTVPPSPVSSTIRGYNYTLNGTTSTTAPTAPEPTVIAGTTTYSPRLFQSTQPASGSYRTFSFSSASLNVCRSSNSSNPSSIIGYLDNSGSPVTATSGQCSGFSSNTSRGTVNGTWTVYEPFQTIYARHTATPYYDNFAYQTIYRLYRLVDQYIQSVIGTTPANMFARVRVCDSSESTTRTDLCTRYPNGNYKPTGEIQKRNEGVRVAAFGYVKEDSNARYGGVLRAPMHFTGPTYRDTDGIIKANANPEWNANTGIFATDPMGVSPTFAMSGVINYLNKFGTTGSTLGYYKALDPVGELYYEALRYFQGLGPTPAAISGLTATHYDGFPIYSTAAASPSTLSGWTDPVQNACQRRNFILTIGDVNTHMDKQLPGLSSLATTDDPTRATEPLLGDATKVFDAVAWTTLLTGFETGTSVSYTDSQGRAQNTSGNPNPNSNNTNLQGKTTGANSAAYYWAGAAYWANTQPIRYDTKGGQSMRNIRVKTFTIDVDEGGNGSIEDTNPRGIKPRRSSFYLAGKYGWFTDGNLDGNPFRASGGLTNNTEWEDASAPNTPDGYVIASQAQKMIDGIRKFFAAAASDRGAVSVSAVSSQRFNSNAPNGYLYSPRFNPTDWSGTVVSTLLTLNTSTQSVESTGAPIWDAGTILTNASLAAGAVSDPMVKPDDRKIFTMSRGSGSMQGQAFTVANKTALDSTVTVKLGLNPANGLVDNQVNARINWIRGSRSDEQNGLGGFLRRRNQIMGDVINSGPVYKQAAAVGLSGTGYSTFAASVANRDGAVYVGSNDGMLHAFRASDGKELFAYIPRAVSEGLNLLTGPGYQHQPYVDGVPVVSEAQIGSTWKTILASGMGGGANGIFALDVTSPASFGASNVLFEFTDQDDSDMGNVLSQPRLVKMRMEGSGTPQYKWFIAVGSGYNNYKNDGNYSLTGRQALFLIGLDKAASDPWVLGTNYYKVMLPDPSSTIASGLANPGTVEGTAGEVLYFYAGDLNGNVWKFNFAQGLSQTKANAAVKTVGGVPVPLAIAKDSGGTRQPITISPIISPGLAGGYMVVFGTGKFMEPSDADSAAVQTMYGIWDPNTVPLTAAASDTDFQVDRTKLFQRTMVLGTTTTVTGSNTFAFGKTSGTYRGWYVDFANTRERIAVEGVSLPGSVVIPSIIPDGTCSGDGTGVSYCFNSLYGFLTCDAKKSSGGLIGKLNTIEIDPTQEVYTQQSSTGKRYYRLNVRAVGPTSNISENTQKLHSASVPQFNIPSDRVGWREIRNFKEN